MSQSDDPGSGPTPHGSTPYGATQSGAQPYGAPPSASPPYGSATPDPGPGGEQQGYPSPGQPPYGQSQYAQPAYGQSPYGQPSYGQPAYGGQYGQQGYGAPAAYGQYGYSAVPPRPGGVITAAVIGFVFAAFGVLATLAVFLGGAALVGMAGAFESAADDPFGGELAGDAATGIGIGIVVVGLICLAWTVVMVWGSVWALTGRSRVLLLVGGSIAVLVTLIGALGGLAEAGSGTTDNTIGVVTSLLFLAAAVAIVVLLCLRPATQFFAAHRARRGR